MAIRLVASGISIEFLRPELSIVSRRRAVLATLVSVPETTVNKQSDASAHKNNIWFAGQIFSV